MVNLFLALNQNKHIMSNFLQRMFPNRYKEAREKEAEFGRKLEGEFDVQKGLLDRREGQLGQYLDAIRNYQTGVKTERDLAEQRLQGGLDRYLRGSGQFRRSLDDVLRSDLADAKKFEGRSDIFRGNVGSVYGQNLADADRYLQDVDRFRGRLSQVYSDLGRNYLDTARGSSIVNQARENQRELLWQNQGNAVRGGGTAESRIAGRGSAQRGFADALRNLAAQGEAYQQNLRGGYLSGLGNVNQMLGQGLGMRERARSGFLSGQAGADQQLLQSLGMGSAARGRFQAGLGNYQNMLGQAQGFEQGIANVGDRYASRLANVLQGAGNYQNLLNTQLGARTGLSQNMQNFYGGRAQQYGEQAGNILEARRKALGEALKLGKKVGGALLTGGGNLAAGGLGQGLSRIFGL